MEKPNPQTTVFLIKRRKSANIIKKVDYSVVFEVYLRQIVKND